MNIIKYKAQFGEYTLPEGFKEELMKHPLDKQIKLYRYSHFFEFNQYKWYERNKQRLLIELNDEAIVSLIEDNNLIVGVIFKTFTSEAICFPEHTITYFYDCENNGAGYKEYEEFRSLVCVPYDYEDYN